MPAVTVSFALPKNRIVSRKDQSGFPKKRACGGLEVENSLATRVVLVARKATFMPTLQHVVRG